MQGAPSRKTDVWEGHQVRLFVLFDFEFYSMRVHSGHDLIGWAGYRWEGIGDILRRNASSNKSILSLHSSERGEMSASLPMSEEMQEILAEEYYRDREMKWMLCVMDAAGDVERQVYIDQGRIVSYQRRDDYVTFTAECQVWASVNDLDARHKRRVDAVRVRFKRGLLDAMVSSAFDWAVSLIEAASNPIGLVVEVLQAVLPGRFRRIVKQRWSARKRSYWFRTEPSVPGMRLCMSGYRVRADTLEEAKSMFCARVAARIWDIPPNFISMAVYSDEEPIGILNLDSIRQNVDLERHKKSSPMAAWPP